MLKLEKLSLISKLNLKQIRVMEPETQKPIIGNSSVFLIRQLFFKNKTLQKIEVP